MGIVRKGKCIQCGRCCASRINVCPYFIWRTTKTIPKGIDIKKTGLGSSLIGVCLIYDKDITFKNCTPEIRKSFPSDPRQVMGNCGYWFETYDGRKIKIEVMRNKLILVV